MGVLAGASGLSVQQQFRVKTMLLDDIQKMPQEGREAVNEILKGVLLRTGNTLARNTTCPFTKAAFDLADVLDKYEVGYEQWT